MKNAIALMMVGILAMVSVGCAYSYIETNSKTGTTMISNGTFLCFGKWPLPPVDVNTDTKR